MSTGRRKLSVRARPCRRCWRPRPRRGTCRARAGSTSRSRPGRVVVVVLRADAHRAAAAAAAPCARASPDRRRGWSAPARARPAAPLRLRPTARDAGADSRRRSRRRTGSRRASARRRVAVGGGRRRGRAGRDDRRAAVRLGAVLVRAWSSRTACRRRRRPLASAASSRTRRRSRRCRCRSGSDSTPPGQLSCASKTLSESLSGTATRRGAGVVGTRRRPRRTVPSRAEQPAELPRWAVGVRPAMRSSSRGASDRGHGACISAAAPRHVRACHRRATPA